MPCTAEKPAAAPPAGVGPQPPRRQAPAQHDRNHLTCRSDARLPARRIRWPLRRRLTRAARFGRKVAITPIAKMLPLKVQDALFFPRISDGGIAPMEIARLVSVIRKERKP